jgi:hypothetical protein
VWRWRPRTGHLDPFFQFSSAGANCWGVVTSEFGQPFHKSGANVGSWFTTPGLVRSSLAVNAQAMNLFQAPIKQVGQEFLHSSHFPAEMQGRMIIGGYYANVLEQHELKLENGMFKSTQLPSIIKSRSTVFRPIEVPTFESGKPVCPSGVQPTQSSIRVQNPDGTWKTVAVGAWMCGTPRPTRQPGYCPHC